MTNDRPHRTSITLHKPVADALYKDKRRDETWNEFFIRTYDLDIEPEPPETDSGAPADD